MWYQQKRLRVVGSKELQETSWTFTATMESLVLHPEVSAEVLKPGYRIWMNKDREKVSKRFMEQAGKDLNAIYQNNPKSCWSPFKRRRTNRR
jgi:hypothetical protein